mmetsp:Transcript_20252/g.24337  ORF Transcript_20252/g.24337 Transcript_20252/m.24337 type:complete len:211 (+) Transcript_20252:618-1250(+)
MNIFVELCKIVVLRVNEGRVNPMDSTRTQNGNQVTTEHDFVSSKGSNGNFATLNASTNHPANDGQHETSPSCNDGSSSRGFAPGHHVPERNDGRTNANSHEQVDPTKIEPHFVECDGEDSHEETEDNNNDTRNLEDLFASCVGVDVFTVDIIGDEGRYGNGFSRTGRHNSHEEHDQNQSRTGISQKLGSYGRRNKTGTSLICGNGKHKSS